MKLFISVSFLVIFSSCINKDSFEKISTENIEEEVFEKANTPIDEFLREGFTWDREGTVITLADSTSLNEYAAKHSALICFVNDEYIGLLSGLRTLDAGWRYLISPTYSDLVILNKLDLSLVFKKRIYNTVSDMNLFEGYVYFEYGAYPDLKYGRYEFN